MLATQFVNWLFVLGSQDSEMQEIERILKEHGLSYVHATSVQRDGSRGRCGPGAKTDMELDEGKALVWVEMYPTVARANATQVFLDHHDPSRPETSFPPERAFEALSLGQLLKFLCILPTKEQMMIGCADHCKAAFAAGLCGVSAEEAGPFIIEADRKAFAPKMSPEEFRAEIEASVESLQNAPRLLDQDGQETDAADLRGMTPNAERPATTGECYPDRAQFLPTASMVCGVPYAVNILSREGRRALRMGGFQPGAQVLVDFDQNPESFGVLPKSAPAPTNAYCFVARGMGGGTYINQ